MRKFSIAFLILGILLTNLGSPVLGDENSQSIGSVVLPSDPYSFQSGKGQEIANIYCVMCHSADYIYMQPEHSKKKWQAIIKKMHHTFGCPIPEDQIPTLATYLYHQNSISPVSQKLSR